MTFVEMDFEKVPKLAMTRISQMAKDVLLIVNPPFRLGFALAVPQPQKTFALLSVGMESSFPQKKLVTMGTSLELMDVRQPAKLFMAGLALLQTILVPKPVEMG